jgi:large subunit ribosomal protein L32
MAGPTNRHSKTRQGKRRSHDHLKAPVRSICPNCSEEKLPHRICPYCGYYKGRQIIEVVEL